MAAIDEYILQFGNNPGLNPDAWAAGTRIENMPTQGGSVWGDIGEFITGIGSTAQTFFGVAGDVRGAHDQYHNPQPTAAELLAYQQAEQQRQMMTYALIGGAVLVAILLFKD
jgi:hypothetical protein